MSEHQLFYPAHPVDPVCFGLNDALVIDRMNRINRMNRDE
jgi:hypothetical protein